MPICHYCREFHQHDPAYPRRRARHNLDTDYPRCHRHWRYVCDLCGQPSHSHFIEPRPSSELVAADPAAWAPDARIPLFVVMGAIK